MADLRFVVVTLQPEGCSAALRGKRRRHFTSALREWLQRARAAAVHDEFDPERHTPDLPARPIAGVPLLWTAVPAENTQPHAIKVTWPWPPVAADGTDDAGRTEPVSAAANGEEAPSPAAANLLRCTFDGVEGYLRAQPDYAGQLEHCIPRGGREPQFDSVERFLAHPELLDQQPAAAAETLAVPGGGVAEIGLEPSIPVALREALTSRGISRFFAHQARAIAAAMSYRDVVVSTATSSGKSLCFNVPVVSELVQSPNRSAALYLFPTKALAQDQLRALNELRGASPVLQQCIRAVVVDGDTPANDRDEARRSGNIFLSNPDFLHATVLPGHNKWRRLLEQLQFVILDEAHVYRGVLGANVAMVLRRLLRLCARYGSSQRLRFIVCSATMGNPVGHFSLLVSRPPVDPVTGERVTRRPVLVSGDTSEHGRFKFIMWNPPIRQEGRSGATAQAAAALVESAAEAQPQSGVLRDGAPSPPLPPAPLRNLNGIPPKRRQPPASPPRCPAGPASSSCPVAARELLALPAQLEATGTAAELALFQDTLELPASCDLHDHAGSSSVSRLEPGAVPPPPLRATSAASARVTSEVRLVRASEQHDRRRSAIVEAAAVVTSLVAGGMSTLCFCTVRKVAELVLQYTRERLAARNLQHLAPLVQSYRGGYLKKQRRRIERKLFRGELAAVIATNALELGVDIGSLDAVVMVGYPGSSCSLWQQAGRAGRRGKDGVAILVAFDSPLDQMFVTQPQMMLAGPPEEAVVDVANPQILRSHALCAAAEAPLCPWDMLVFGPALGAVVKRLREQEVLFREDSPAGTGLGSITPAVAMLCGLEPVGPARRSKPRSDVEGRGNGAVQVIAWATGELARPAAATPLRSADDVSFTVRDVTTGRVVDEVAYTNAQFELHEGAIYMNSGSNYLVQRLDFKNLVALVRPTNAAYYTSTTETNDINVVSTARSCLFGRTHFGRVQARTQVVGFKKCWRRSGGVFDSADLLMPPQLKHTHGLWNDVPLPVKQWMDTRSLDLLGGCHAAAHAVINVLPRVVLCEPRDVSTECPALLQRRSRPDRFVIVDNHNGGIGIAAAAFRHAERLYNLALDLVESCPCTRGCPRCTHGTHCREYNQVSDKQAAVVILRAALGSLPPGISVRRNGASGGQAAPARRSDRPKPAFPDPFSLPPVDPLLVGGAEGAAMLGRFRPTQGLPSLAAVGRDPGKAAGQRQHHANKKRRF